MTNKQKKTTFNKNFHEYEAWNNLSTVLGVDEVGRGCLAGPLVTCALILPISKTHRLLKDSKLMTHEERLIAYEWINKHCIFTIGIIHHRLIDKCNIWNATLLCMRKAVISLLTGIKNKPTKILIDAMPLTLKNTAYENIPISHFINGEKKSSSIAAASIVAKVTRDYIMNKLSLNFPGYKLEKHKGYSTPEHKFAVRILSPSIIHRKTFLKKIFSTETDITANLSVFTEEVFNNK